MSKLTARQQKLLNKISTPLRVETALFYISGGYSNQSEAYLKACEKLGKKPAKVPFSSACEILNMPDVSAFVDSVKFQAAETVNIDAAWVLSQAVNVYNRCMQVVQVTDRAGEPVYVEGPEGDLVPAFTFEHSGANKSLEIIGKHVSVRAFEKETSVVVSNNILPIPTAASVDEWESIAQNQQDKALGKNG